MNAADEPVTQLPERPYRGIESFRFVDHPIFGARRRETEKLLRWITIYRGVLLYGAPSVGKSSLVNAGLLPAALGQGFSPMRIRVQPRPGEEIIVERIALTDQGRPPYLPSFLAPAGNGEARIVLAAAELVQRLRDRGEGPLPLLVFDQFEEFVTLFEEAPRGQQQQRDAAVAQNALLEAITELLRDHSFAAKLLFSFREDYLGKLNRVFARYPSLLDLGVRLAPVDKGSLPEILRGPFRTPELREHFKGGFPEPLLVELQRQIEAHSEGAALNLTTVQIACLRLWQAGEREALLQRRGVQGLMEDYLAESLDQLGRLRDPAVALLGQMVTAQGTRNVISEDNLLSSTAKEERVPEVTLRAALEKLESDTALVRKEHRNEVHVYEIVSEFLVPWIRRQRLDRERQRLERRFQRRASLVTVAVLLVLGGFLTVRTVKLNYEVRKADEVRQLNEERTKLDRELNLAQDQLRAAQAQSRQRQQELRKANDDLLNANIAATKTADDLRAQLDQSAQLRHILEQKVAQLNTAASTSAQQLGTCQAQRQAADDAKDLVQGRLQSCQSQSNVCEQAMGQARLRLAELEKFGKTCPEIETSNKLSTEITGMESNLTLLETALPRIKCKDFSSDATLARAQVGLHRDKVEEGLENLQKLLRIRGRRP